jgi:transcriptional regulator with XRE-family HTH domain
MSNRRPVPRVSFLENQLARSLGRRLRYLRAQIGLTQSELGRKASMDRAYISRLERGRVLPRYSALANSLGVSVAVIVEPAHTLSTNRM